MIQNERSIAVYNPEKQELIGVFKTPTMAAKYLMSGDIRYGCQRVRSALHSKGKTKATRINLKVAIRYANESQLLLLTDNDWWIHKDYPSVHQQRMEGMKFLNASSNLNV